jgi:cytochrome c
MGACDRKFRRPLLILTAAMVFLVSGCVGEVNGVPGPRVVPGGRVAVGRGLIARYGCGACHLIPGVPGADSMAAPPLDHFYERTYIAGRLPNTEENLLTWIQAPQQIEPGTAMPDLGVTQDEARDMAAYLYHQPSLGDIVNR